MDRQERSPDLRAFTQETQSIWDRNAVFWDEKMGEGNQFQKLLVAPATERLLELEPGELVLDVACGNGVFARRLAELGARVVACDFSERLLERARARGTQRIEYLLVDATNEEQLLALGRRRFDAAVCNMALMDMTAIEPLMRALSQILKPDGRFVFSVSHPCFNSTGCKMVIEEETRDGELVVAYSVKVSNYLRLPPSKGLGILGQPEPHYYFDRPISVLCNACFRAGFVMDGLEEPSFDANADAERPFSWPNFTDIPPVLVARMRLIPQR
ncbi:MAG: class I SAM-dependent methyltransferase [Chloroflexota bacterium]|nr:class I SAM-dependent methyltransferase [Chloroflexota bacterium]